ncbi:extracellular solute-binding protein [Nesterenkonia sp. F]|uniref:extracellular solute-binding protein n=1 Tax=Nesterenkonia sp. F TaxID=795955 RepID=UPI0002F6593E|nr:extracellular solute-binding protein [Nesterenkonia sp. F]
MITRRQLLGGVGALAGAGALAGCSPTGAPPGADTLQFWHLLSGGDGVTMQSLLDRINESQDDYFVRPTVLEWGTPYYTKLAMAGSGGRAPEAAIMHSSRVPGYVPGGLLDPWDTGRLAELGVSRDTFTGPMWNNSLVGDQLYSVPLDAHPFMMFSNREVLRQADVLEDGGFPAVSTPQDFVDVLREITAAAPEHGLSYGFIGDGAQMWRLFYTLYAQHGAEMSFPQGGSAQIDDEAAVESLRLMSQLVDGEIASSQGTIDAGIAEFSAGSSGLLFSGVWELPPMQDAGIDVNIEMIPPVFGQHAVYADSHAFVLPHQQDPDPEKREDTYAFVAELLKNSFDWAGAGHIPAYVPITEDPQYDELQPQANYAGAADHIVYDPKSWFTGSGANFQADFGQVVQDSIRGGDGFQEAVDGLRSMVDAILAEPNPVDPEGTWNP